MNDHDCVAFGVFGFLRVSWPRDAFEWVLMVVLVEWMLHWALKCLQNTQRVTSAHNHQVDLNFECTKAGCGNDGLSKSREV